MADPVTASRLLSAALREPHARLMFIHEYTHLMDRVRYRTDEPLGGERRMQSPENQRRIDPRDAYFRNSSEFNAFFQSIVSSLDDLGRSDLGTLGWLLGRSPSGFGDRLRQWIRTSKYDRAVGANAGFIDAMLDDAGPHAEVGRRKFLKRLAQAWGELRVKHGLNRAAVHENRNDYATSQAARETWARVMGWARIASRKARASSRESKGDHIARPELLDSIGLTRVYIGQPTPVYQSRLPITPVVPDGFRAEPVVLRFVLPSWFKGHAVGGTHSGPHNTGITDPDYSAIPHVITLTVEPPKEADGFYPASEWDYERRFCVNLPDMLSRVYRTFVHEYTHYLDEQKYKDRAAAGSTWMKPSLDAFWKNGGEIGDAYYTGPHEVNARVQEIIAHFQHEIDSKAEANRPVLDDMRAAFKDYQDKGGDKTFAVWHGESWEDVVRYLLYGSAITEHPTTFAIRVRAYGLPSPEFWAVLDKHPAILRRVLKRLAMAHGALKARGERLVNQYLHFGLTPGILVKRAKVRVDANGRKVPRGKTHFGFEYGLRAPPRARAVSGSRSRRPRRP